MKQKEFIKQLSKEQITQAVLLSQLFFFILSLILYFIFMRDINKLSNLIQLNWDEIFYYGIVLAVILVFIEIILYILLPKHHFDDGGINIKLFQNQSNVMIFTLALIIAIVEELLFRGILQTLFGYMFASLLFIVLHTRYLKKPILLFILICTSFLIGYLFLLTNNLLVTIVFHFVVDFLLGLFIKYYTR